MKNILLIILILMSVRIIAQTKVTAGKDTANKSKTTKGNTAANKSKSTVVYKTINTQYQDSVSKYRELATYYRTMHHGPKDTSAVHFQKLSIAYQRRHVLLNRVALAYNDSLVRIRKKEELEKKYKIAIR